MHEVAGQSGRGVLLGVVAKDNEIDIIVAREVLK
jgi:hypothetical protein